jgi:hypothetical protein
MCRVPQAGGEPAWYSFNDEQVTRVSPNQASAMREAWLPVFVPSVACVGIVCGITIPRLKALHLDNSLLALCGRLVVQVVSQYAYILFYVRTRASSLAHHRRNNSAASGGAGGGA